MTLVGRQDPESLFQRFAERQRAIHTLVGDLFDLVFEILAIRMAVERDLGEHIECLNLGESAIEIDYEVLIRLH